MCAACLSMWLVALAARGDPSARPDLPDLALDRDTLATDLSIETRDFGGDACELTEVDRFGRSGALARDEGARREGVAVVDAIDALALRVRPSPSQPCIGDSGGPAFATIAGVEHLVGVTSHGDSVCTSFGVETRVDAYVDDLVKPLIDDVARCADGACQTEESGCAAAGVRRPSAGWLLLAAAIVCRALRRRRSVRGAIGRREAVRV